MSRGLRFAPLLVLLLVIGAMVWRLATPTDTNVTSKLVGRPLPAVLLGPTDFNGNPFPLRSLTGKPMILNFFGSWCLPCVGEAPMLEALKKRGVRIVGIAVRDTPDAVADFVEQRGNPYAVIGMDPESKTQIALGSSGVPESFVVDGKGIIRYQHIGPIAADDVPMLLKRLDQLQ